MIRLIKYTDTRYTNVSPAVKNNSKSNYEYSLIITIIIIIIIIMVTVAQGNEKNTRNNNENNINSNNNDCNSNKYEIFDNTIFKITYTNNISSTMVTYMLTINEYV